MEKKLKDKESELKHKDQELRTKDAELELLQKERDDIWKRYDHRIYEMKKTMDEKDDLLKNMKQRLDIQQKEKQMYDGKAVEMQQEISKLKQTVGKQKFALEEKEDKLKQNDKELSKKTEYFDVLKKKYDKVEQELFGICKDYDAKAKEMQQEISKLKSNVGKLQATLSEKQARLDENHSTFGNMEKQIEAANSKIISLDNENMALHMQCKETRYALEKANKTVDYMKESHEDAIRHKDNQLKELIVDRDDLRNRYDGKAVEMQQEISKLKQTVGKQKFALEEKEDKLKQNDKELSKKTEYFDVLKKKYDKVEQELFGICKDYDAKAKEMQQEISKLKSNVGKLQATLSEKQARLDENHSTFGNMEKQIEAANSKIISLDNENMALHMQCMETRYALEKANKTVDYMKESHEDAIRHKDNQLKELIVDRDDLRNRLSKEFGGKVHQLQQPNPVSGRSSIPTGGEVSGKLAGNKLTDQNPDIADLSDPNRAIKLSERFGGLYDDQWTDAYEHLVGKKKMTVKDAITLLLDVLKKCEAFCNKLKETQMDSLKNVLLHPSQDVSSFESEPCKHVGGLKEHARIKSDDKKAVRELRLRIGVRDCVLEEVKQVFIQESKSWPDKKVLEGCIPYLQKCAEICWLMVLHDPPLYMKMDVKREDHFDTSLYSVYSASGDKIDFLVWPALFNEKNGGLLSKGTAEPFKVVKKT